MKTDCKTNRMEIQGLGNRQVIGEFNCGDITLGFRSFYYAEFFFPVLKERS
jgi:hypothetical protein